MNPPKIELVQGDITRLTADAIFNAANSSLMGGGGVDGAIHRAGGPAILEACRKIIAQQGRCQTGEAVITHGGNLPATFVIHTERSVWNGGQNGEAEKLLRKGAITGKREPMQDHCFSGNKYRYLPVSNRSGRDCCKNSFSVSIRKGGN
jgi:hypothetical protein